MVVDTSIVLKWMLDEPDSTTALSLLTKCVNEGTVIHAPALLTYEVANALFQHVRKGEMSAEKARQALEDVLLPELELNFLEYTEKCEYWTADSRLYNAVKDKLPWVHQLNEYHGNMH